jgi:gliding motility-associated-like protein
VPSAVVPFSINQAPKIAAIADPGPICSGTVLSLSNPAIIDNGSSIIRQGWQLNGADYSPSTPLTYADNGGKLVYSAENSCGIITSNEIIVKVNQAPEIAAIIPPSPICANSSLVLTAPAVNPNGASIINKGWQLDGVYFDPSTTLLTFADNIKKLKYNVESGCGNIPSPLVLFTVNQAPDIAAIAAPAAICEGSPLTLADPAVAVNGSTIINKEGWQLNGKYFNPSTPLTYADNDKNLTYKVESSCGNVPSNSVKVTIFPLPQVTLPNELIASADERTTLTPEIKGTIVKYVWLPEEGLSCYDCETPVFQFKKSSNYKLTVESSDGCRASSSIAIKLMERFMPNAFSPDGNGINDRFTVTGQNIKLVKSFRIYNRFGNLVFIRSNIHPNDSNNGWDGTVDGKPVNQTTTFAYAIEYVNNEGNSKIEKGTVMLIR